jgi:hypothetical protein
VSLMWSLNHTIAAVVILVACAVMLWLILRDAKVVKINVNANGDLVKSLLDSSVNVGPNKLLFSLMWRGTKSIPLDWDVALRDAFVGRIHPPMTAEFLGRKVTVIVDGRDDKVERPIVILKDLPLGKRDDTPDDRRGFAKIKIMLFLGNGELQMAAALRDEYAKKCNQGGNGAADY